MMSGNDEKKVERPLTEEELAALKKALSWNNGQGYDGDGPEDVFEPIEIVGVE